MAGFLKRMFSFGRKETTEPGEQGRDVPLAGCDTEAAQATEAAPELDTEAAPTDSERRHGGKDDDPTVVPPDYSEPADAPKPVADGSDPADGLRPNASPAPATEPAGGTVLDHAHQDAIALEETGELPTEGPSEHERDTVAVLGAVATDSEAPSSTPPRPKRYFSAEPKTAAEAEPTPGPQADGFFARLRAGLGRSSRELSQSISSVFTKRKLDDDTLQDLEDVLVRADLGLDVAMRITDRLSESRYGKEVGTDEVRGILAQEVARVLEPVAQPLELDLEKRPHVILVVGVNGTGKTTTIGKLAAKLRAGGLSVMLAAGDTFRAAAIEQLHIWGDRVGAEVVSTKLGSDAASLAYEAYERAEAAGVDVLLIDTAGRLQNKTELMDELAKVVRVLKKHDPDAPHTVLQTLDATTGQNALSQVEIFRERAGVGGLVMTKLDGTARGGILVAIAAKHQLPVWFIGVGEGVDDLEPFRADEFARAITGSAAERAPA